MNMLDMHTREQVNKIHIAGMHQEARSRHLLRGLGGTGIPAIAKGKMRLVLVVVVLIVVIGTLRPL